MADRTNTSQGAGTAPTAERSRRHPQRGSGRAVGGRQDHPRRSPAGCRGRADQSGLGRRRQHSLRLRRGRDPATAIGGRCRGLLVARRHQGQPRRHTRIRRLRRRVAGRVARRGLRAVRDRGERRRRRADQIAVAGMQPGRHAPRRGDHQTRPRPRELPGGTGRRTERVRRQGLTALPADRPAILRRPDRAAIADALPVRRR